MDENVIAEARAALAEHGFQCRHIESLSPPASGRKSGRCTLRVELADGSTIKVRCLESLEEASRLTDLRSRANPSFAPVIARCGAILLESWIDGEELSPAQAAARADEVGAMVGRLHATELPGNPPRTTTRVRRERAAEQLGTLVESGVVSLKQREALHAELLRTDPGETRQTMVHLDYCPENLVVDSGGGLHVVDNEWIRVDAPGLDLGRTYSRWPMSDEVWKRFLRGYLTTAPFDPGPLRFWMIIMSVASATIRLQTSFAALAVPRARLHQLAAVS